MPKFVTAAQAKQLDRYTIEEVGIPSVVLMERASLAIRDAIITSKFNLERILVVAGMGNNGGDGLCVARLLKVAGYDVAVLTVGDSDHATAENELQASICDHYQIPQFDELTIPFQPTVVLDAIFGVGIDRPVTGRFADAIKFINGLDSPVVAIDVPSGLNSDTGKPMGIAVQADLTVTVAFPKVGFQTEAGQHAIGQLVVADDMGIYD